MNEYGILKCYKLWLSVYLKLFCCISRIIMLFLAAMVSLRDIGLLLLRVLLLNWTSSIRGLIELRSPVFLRRLVFLRDAIVNWDVVTIIETIRVLVGLLVSRCIVNIILRLWVKNSRVHYLRLPWDSFRIRVFAVRAYIHVAVVILLFQRRPPFLTNQWVVVFIFCVFFEECLGSWWLALIVMSAHVATYIFTLVEIIIVYIFLHALFTHVRSWPHDNTSPTSLISVI